MDKYVFTWDRTEKHRCVMGPQIASTADHHYHPCTICNRLIIR